MSWTEAFYDYDYQRDQTRRTKIVNDVLEFLTSIGCRASWTCCHDGSDIDFDYGIFISTVTYQGKTYEHNPCYQVRWELPVELLEKLDAKFGVDEMTPGRRAERRRAKVLVEYFPYLEIVPRND